MAEASFIELGAALEAKVARLREEGRSREEVADLTDEERTEYFRARSAAFAGATQGRGKPLSKQSHGTGKKPGEK